MSETTKGKPTPGPWVALEGDTFNSERPWGVSKYLSIEACREIDGDEATYPSRTEIIAEVCDGTMGVAEADARLIVAAVNACFEIAGPEGDALKVAETLPNLATLVRAVEDLEEVWDWADNMSDGAPDAGAEAHAANRAYGPLERVREALAKLKAVEGGSCG